MRLLQTITKVFLLTILSVWLTACGGGGGGDSGSGSDPEPDTVTNCVLGSSAVGECKL